MFTQRTLMSLCQYLAIQPWADLNVLFQKHGISDGWVDDRWIDRQTTFNTIAALLSRSSRESLSSMLSEIRRTQGNLRNRISPRYIYDERWTDFQACLTLEGYQWSEDGRLITSQPVIEGGAAVEDDLTAELARCGLPEATHVVQLIGNSAADFRAVPPDFNGCLNNARVALQTLATAISRNRAASRPVGFDETKWGQVLAHLRTSGFITPKEEEGIAGVFSFVSPGSHVPIGFSDAEMTRLGRNLVTAMCYFLVKRFNG